MRQRQRRDPWAIRNKEAIRFVRDTVFTVFGLLIIYHEVYGREDPRELALTVALVLCGLPVALRLDQILKSRSEQGQGDGNGGTRY